MENTAMRMWKIEQVLSSPAFQMTILTIIIIISLIVMIVGITKTIKELNDCYHLIHGKINKREKIKRFFKELF